MRLSAQKCPEMEGKRLKVQQSITSSSRELAADFNEQQKKHCSLFHALLFESHLGRVKSKSNQSCHFKLEC